VQYLKFHWDSSFWLIFADHDDVKANAQILGVDLEGQKIVMVSGPASVSEKIDGLNRLERYFDHL
jgi:hypothetical protein